MIRSKDCYIEGKFYSVVHGIIFGCNFEMTLIPLFGDWSVKLFNLHAVLLFSQTRWL